MYINCRDGPSGADAVYTESHSRVPRSKIKANNKATEDTVQTLKHSPLIYFSLQICNRKIIIIITISQQSA